uniref:Major facilitator superfamily (MFS) profile domain-containing protein n=1 Tax=Nothoprocta perdicaria TaxID=30464 RepID=A0A8C7EDX0_NOTPE
GAVLEEYIQKFINETWLERYGSVLHQETLTLLWSLIVSMYCVGGMIGCLCSGHLTAKYGKRKCLLCNNLLMITGALIMGCSKIARSFEMILIGRFICGLCVPLHHQYVGEISPRKLRGFANSTASFFWSLGKAVGQIVGQRYNTFDSPPDLFLALIQLVTLPFFPETPPYLLMQREDQEAIRKLWGEGDHQAEIDDMMKEKATMASTKSLRVLEIIKERSLRWQLYILMTVITTLQLCGINAVEYKSSDKSTEGRICCLQELGFMTCETSVFSAFQSTLIERFGRKALLLGGYTLMGFVLALLTMTLSLALFLCSAFSAGATISIMVEIFSQSFRPSAFLIVGCINWMGLFVLGMIFPVIVDNLGPFCFLIFLGILALSTVFVYMYLPETKGKSIMEIKAEFNKLNFGKKETPVTENNFPKEQLFCTRL